MIFLTNSRRIWASSRYFIGFLDATAYFLPYFTGIFSRKSCSASTTVRLPRSNVGSSELSWKVCNNVPTVLNSCNPSYAKDMVISVKETTVFSVFHPDAQDLYNTCSDLKKVAYELWDPSFRLDASVLSWIVFCMEPTLIINTCRTRLYNYSMPSRPCYANVPPGKSKRPCVRWAAPSFSLRRSLMARECSSTSEGTNFSIALGMCYVPYSPLSFDAKRLAAGKARTTPTSMASTLEPEVWHPSSRRHSILA